MLTPDPFCVHMDDSGGVLGFASQLGPGIEHRQLERRGAAGFFAMGNPIVPDPKKPTTSFLTPLDSRGKAAV